MNKHLVIGSGSIARRHIVNLGALFPAAEISCASASGRTLGINETAANYHFSRVDDALRWGPDMAIVASPAPFHLEHALACLRQGIPVLIEKPLTDSFASFKKHAAELASYSASLEVGYNLRYLPSATRMKELIDRGTIGKLRSISIDLGQYLPDWRPQNDYRKGVSANQSMGGGVLLELSHEFDYLSWIFGKFDSVYGILSNSGALEIDVEDRADILLSRVDGLVAHLHLDFLQRRATRRCKVVGEAGNLVWDLLANNISLEVKDSVSHLFEDANFDRNQMYQKQLLHFVAVAQGNALPMVGLENAAYALKMIEAIRTSAELKRPIPLQGLEK